MRTKPLLALVTLLASGCGAATYRSEKASYTATFPRSTWIVDSAELAAPDGYHLSAVSASPTPSGDPEWFVLAIAPPSGTRWDASVMASNVQTMLAEVAGVLTTSSCTRSIERAVVEGVAAGVEQRWACPWRRRFGVKVFTSASLLVVSGVVRGWGARWSHARLDVDDDGRVARKVVVTLPSPVRQVLRHMTTLLVQFWKP